MRKFFLPLGLFGAAMTMSSVSAEALPPIVPEDVQTGESWFSLIRHEKHSGEMYYAVARDDDALVIHAATSLYPDIRESESLAIDARTFAPRSITVDGDFRRSILDAELAWEDGRVKGQYKTKSPDALVKSVTPIDREALGDAIARPSIFGLLTGMQMEVGAEYAFKWFAALQGDYADVRLTVDGIETVETPAGAFETYKLTIDATPKNIAYVTTALPQKVVRIDVVGQDMRFELLPARETALKQ